MRIDKQCDVFLGVDVGGTNFRLGLVNRDFELLKFEIFSTQEILDHGYPIKNLHKVISGFLDRNIGDRQLLAISMGFPSTVDRERRVVRSTPNIPAMQNLHIVDELEKFFECPIFINRDVNFLLLHDLWSINIARNSIVVGIYYGTGLGNAIYINGHLLVGKNGVAAELGHIPVLYNKRKCPCGNEGCLELIASGKRLVDLISENFPGTDIADVFSLHAESTEIKEYIRALAAAAATEVNIFDPDYLILGGGIMQMKDFPKELLEQKIIDQSRKPYPADNLNIIYSEPRQDNGVVGAAIYADMRLNSISD